MRTEDMTVLVVGSGGREHTLATFIEKSPRVKKVLCAPGNGAFDQEHCINVKETDFEGLFKVVCENSVDFVVIGPEAPLAAGIVDFFRERGIVAFGPSENAAIIEASKVFGKELCMAAGVPTAEYRVANNYDEAVRIVNEWGAPVVVKADGLCAGKGVTVATTVDKAKEFIYELMVDKIHGNAGNRVVIERKLPGRECSVMPICDGENAVLLPPARDYKRIWNDDMGANTGGMGAYSPLPDVDENLLLRIKKEIVLPVLKTMGKMGRPFHGVLYVGLMINDNNDPRVLEFNCRFGDPETQVVLPRLKSDIVELMLASCNKGGLAEFGEVEVYPTAAVGVVAASKGYPGKNLDLGHTIRGIEEAKKFGYVFEAGTTRTSAGLVSNSGGRVLSVVGMGNSIKNARNNAYLGMERIDFQGVQFRTDIAEGV
jgi:phosphoribosylamine--glycine ligase